MPLGDPVFPLLIFIFMESDFFCTLSSEADLLLCLLFLDRLEDFPSTESSVGFKPVGVMM